MATPIADRNVYVWWSLAVIGLGFLLPWDAIITAVDYLNMQFPNEHVEFKVAAAYMLSNFATMALTVRFNVGVYVNVHLRMLLGFTLLLLLVVIIAFITNLAAFLVCVCLTGMGDGFTQLSVYGYTAGFPNNEYSGAVMSGNGVAGLVAVMLRIITKLAYPQNTDGLRDGARVHFFVSGSVIVLCIACVVYLSRSAAVGQYHVGANVDDVELAQTSSPPDSSDNTAAAATTSTSSMVIKLMRKLKFYGGAVCLNFLITLSLFPGLTSEFESTMIFNMSDGWFSVLVMATFMVFDYIGRTRPTWGYCGIKPSPFMEGTTLLRAAVCRLIFIPLLFISYFAQRGFGGYALQWLGSEIVILFVVIAFALSNGYVSTLCMMCGPTVIEDSDQHRERAGNLMAFCLVSGLTFGAVIGMLISLAL